jgi:hypothetical protein
MDSGRLIARCHEGNMVVASASWKVQGCICMLYAYLSQS